MVVSLVNVSWKPVRVIVDEDGHAIPPDAALKMAINSDVIFVREDGWSLGAPKELEDIAYNMWRNDWAQFIRKGDKDWTNIKEYKRENVNV